jgi:hypothetical protein
VVSVLPMSPYSSIRDAIAGLLRRDEGYSHPPLFNVRRSEPRAN